MTYHRRTYRSGFPVLLLLLVFVWCAPAQAQVQQENRLRRIQIVPQAGQTRINFFFQDPPDYQVSRLPGRIRLMVKGADAPTFRKARSYGDSRVAGVFTSLRHGGVRVEMPIRGGEPAVQVLSEGNPSVLSLLISTGRAEPVTPRPDIVAGREAILSGAAELIKEIGSPARAGLPFAPTDVKLIDKLLTEDEVASFLQGEELLYLEKGSEAAQVFAAVLGKHQTVQALASYRLGEAFCLMERNAEALQAFKQAEALWPGYLDQAPELMQVYAETLMKNGDYAGGRALLVRLMGKLSGTPYMAPLLNRLAEMAERNGETEQALGMYRAVARYAQGTEAASRARMKLADREMFSLPQGRYPELSRRYQSIYDAPGGMALRDEALFKMALLPALYGPAAEGLEASVTYDRRYPRGIFSTVVKKMREQLLVPVYRELVQARDDAALVRLGLDNREYLSLCLAEPDFLQHLSSAFQATAMPAEEIELFSYLAERSWGAGQAAFMLARIVENAFAVGNLTLAESSARRFLVRFPRDARGARMREHLGKLAFDRGDLPGTLSELRFLGAKGAQPQFPESHYYLGKALSHAGDHRGAEASMVRFTETAPADSPLLTDGYCATAGAREALKDYRGALAAYQQGAKVATGERVEQCLYKMGELYLQLGMARQAANSWEQAVQRGGSGSWVKLASESLGDIRWRLKIASELR